jgi:hypothetical protein
VRKKAFKKGTTLGLGNNSILTYRRLGSNMSIEKFACISTQCNCVNAYLHSKVNTFQYKELTAELVKLLQAKKKEKKVLGVLLKLVYFRLDIELIPTLLERMF